MPETQQKTVRVFWYDHDCEWLSDYCDEYHRRSNEVPLEQYIEFLEQNRVR